MPTQKKVIPFKYYGRFIVISILFIIAISVVVYTNFMRDDKYDFPFIKTMKSGKEVVRIYPASSFNNLVIDDNPFTYTKAKDLIDKSISYEGISDYNFGKIDHYLESGIYKVYDRFDINYLTLYEKDKKFIGFTYKYIFNKSGTSEFPEREYIYQDILRMEKMIGSDYTAELNKGSKNFVIKRNNRIYVLTIIADNISEDTIGKILNYNKEISLNISIFNTVESYNYAKSNINN